MWRKLRKQIAVERELLGRLVEDHQPLLLKCRSSEPDRIELSALAAMLHGLYNGEENIFKREKIELDEELPGGGDWHAKLPEKMTHPGAHRPALITPALARRLKGYLEFRHVFRHAYAFQLRWDRMGELVNECSDTLRRLEAEIDAFLSAAESRE